MCGFESRVEYVPGRSKRVEAIAKTDAENHVIVVRQRIGESVAPSTEAAERSAPVHHG